MPEVQNPALEAWVGLLRGQRAASRDLGTDLERAHGLSISDFETLVHLSQAEDGRLRRTDLAERLQLSASGVTRLLEGLEGLGLVRKANCASDGRVTYAELTDKGREALAAASCSHVAAIEKLFADRFEQDEVAQLATLLGRL